jgi:tetratricopeptide (TPR) repeat protein
MRFKVFIVFLIIINMLIQATVAVSAKTNIDSLLKVLRKADDSKKPELYLQLAKGYLEKKSYDESIGYLEKAIKVSSGRVKNETMMKVYYTLGDNYIWKKDYVKVFNSLDKSLEIAQAIKEKDFQIDIYLLYAYAYRDKVNWKELINCIDKAIDIAGGQDLKIMSSAYYLRGDAYLRIGNLEKSLQDLLKALGIAKAFNEKGSQSRILNSIGVVYKTKGEYPKAIEYLQQNLKVQESSGDSAGIGTTYNNLANVYWSFGIMSKAIEYYNKSIDINQNLHNDIKVGILYINIALAYKEKKENNKALEYLKRGQALFLKLNFKLGLAQAQGEMGTIYAEGGNYQMALKYHEDALAVYRSLGEKGSIAVALRSIGETYNKSGNYATALDYYKQSIELEKQAGMKKEMLDNYKDIASVYSNMGEYKSAFQNFQLYSNLKDSTLSEDFLRQMQELEAKYENDKKESEIKLQKSDLAKKDLEAKRKNIMLIGVGFIALIILAFSFVIFKQYSDKKKANVLLAQQNDQITKQRDQIFQQKKEITDSIHYASRIQRAVLPSPKMLEDYGLQYFILYKPRDIVSGDFYWMHQKEEKVLIAAADCTGHGVPGAFMSMLGMAFLNEIVTKGDFNNAAQILDQLRNLVVKSLHQSGKMEETKDGMDISLCMIDKENAVAQFAGAFNSMYLIRGTELIEGPADRMPVGFHDKLHVPFTNTILELQKGDSLYIFSDGYIDQFGGENGKKFMAKKFKQLLLGLQEEPMETQKEILDRTITEWRGELDQVDDIMVIGLRV